MLRPLLIPPVFATQEQTERARIFHYVIGAGILIATGLVAGLIIVQPELASYAGSRVALIDLLGLIGLELNRRGKTRFASWVCVIGFVSIVTFNSLPAGGIRAPGVTMFYVFALLAGLLLGEAAGIATALACAAIGLGLVGVENAGLLPAQTIHYSPTSYWLLNCLYMGVVILLVRLATQTIGKALKRAETELAERKLAEQMRDEAERQRAALQEQLTQSQKMEALGTLAGGVAHDFNNLLGAIQGFARLIESDVSPGVPPHNFAQRILTACDRGKELVEQILALAHTGFQDRSVISLPGILKECETLIAASLPESVHLNINRPEEDLRALAHRGQISQLIINLCRNAGDSIGARSGNVGIELSRAPHVDFAKWSERPRQENWLAVGTLNGANEYARIRVSDDGAGIPADILKRVFDPFFTTKGRGRGTGLGLAVVHGVVESHGGACSVESAPGRGTTFSVYLPLTNAPAVDVRPTVQDDSAAGSERILVVDDEPDIADMLVIGLDRLGYNVVAVNNPIDALDAFQEDPGAWDAVITDQLMPGMLGTDLLAKLKSTRPGIKTVLCTGFADRAEPATSQDIDAFLRKPTDAQAIARSLRNLFDRAPAHAE